MKFEWIPTLDSMKVNYILLMDDNRHWYHSCYDEVLELLTPYKPVCLGASMGGYGAFMFAEQMGTRAIAFAPQTILSLEGKARIRDNRWEELHRMVYEVAKHPLDLTCSGNNYQLHYCRGSALDKLHAEQLDVFKIEHDCDTHHVARCVDLTKM